MKSKLYKVVASLISSNDTVPEQQSSPECISLSKWMEVRLKLDKICNISGEEVCNLRFLCCLNMSEAHSVKQASLSWKQRGTENQEYHTLRDVPTHVTSRSGTESLTTAASETQLYRTISLWCVVILSNIRVSLSKLNYYYWI